MYGSWTEETRAIGERYRAAQPYEHVIINNFFKNNFAEEVHDLLPDTPDATWWKYDNPFEGKHLFNNFKEGDPIRRVIDQLYSPEMMRYISEITGIEGLEADPHLNAGGLHYYTRNDLSGIHLDYTVHPISGKERRVSIMVYLTKGWDPAWGGQLSLWNDDLSERTRVEHSLWNTAVIFRTNGLAYHGFPEPIKCPPGMFRKVIGIYYLTDASPETLAAPRLNATYFTEPGKEIPEKLKKLYDIRKYRRLEAADLEDWPTWREDCGRSDKD